MLSKTKNSGFFARMRVPPIGRWVLIVALLAAIGGGYYYYRGKSQSAQTSTAAKSELKTAVARQGNLVLYASGSGTLISQSETSFGFNTSGQVTKIDVSVGDEVKTGQTLAELDGTSAKLNLEKAQHALDDLTSPAAIATAQDAAATAQYNVSTTREDLQYLVSPAVQIWQERLDNAKQALADAKAAADANPSDETKQQLQLAQDTVTQDEYYLEQAQKAYDTYLKDNFSEMRTDRRTGNMRIIYYRDPLTGKRYSIQHPPTDAEIAIAQANYDLAKATFQEAQDYLSAISTGTIPEGATSASLTALENAQADVQSAQMELDNTSLVAPISGKVMSLDFKVGDFVGSNSSIITIADLSQPTLEIFLQPSDWANVVVGYETDVVFDILPDSTFIGKVVRVDPGLYTGNTTPVVRAIVELDKVNSSFNLPLGSSASVSVIGGRAENAVLIPVEALHKAGDQYAVFIMKNGELSLHIIGVGLQNSLYAEVTSGLKAGDVVSTGLTQTK